MSPVNEKVAKASKSIGKSIENMPASLQQYHYDMQAEHQAIKDRRLQYAYSRFIEKNVMTRSEFRKLSNYPDEMSKTVLNELVSMGLITYTTLFYMNNSKLYAIKDEKYIPEGWPAKGELLNMESPYKDYIYTPKTKASEQDIKDATDNPLTKMLLNKDIHVKDTSSYEQLIKDTSRFYGLDEIDDLIKAIHEICKRRIEQKYVECPLCRGRIQRNRSEIHCTNCGLLLNGGTFENSMKMAHLIAKGGVKVQ